MTEVSYSGRLQGFIRPPPDIKVIIDKTASFVANHGTDYEKKILAQTSDSASGKFGFLKPENPYHAYYRHRIAECKEGKQSEETPQAKPTNDATATSSNTDNATSSNTTDGSAETAPPVEVPSTQRQVVKRSAGIVNPLSKALKALQVRENSDEPVDIESLPVPKDEYTVTLPPTYAVAQQTGLLQSSLDTLRLTAQYTAVHGKAFLSQLTQAQFRNPDFDFLKPSNVLFGYFTALVDAYSRVLHPQPSVLARLAEDKQSLSGILKRCVLRLESKRREDERKREEAAAAAGGAALVDWHDFSIVETITFADEDDSSLPAPQAAPLGASSLRGATKRVQLGEDEQIKVRTDYVPGAATAPSHRPVATFLDPRTGREIPVESAADQVRVELLDPRWKQQQQTYLSRRAESLYVGGDEVAENLKRLAARRTDIFADRPSESNEPAAKRARVVEEEQAPGT